MTDLAPLDLPDSILSRQVLRPPEDFLLPLLRQELVGMQVHSLIPMHFPTSMVLIRKSLGTGDWNGDHRGFIDDVYINVDAFATDPDGDEKGALISEAVRVVLFTAWRNQTVINNMSISWLHMTAEPNRKSDFIDSAGPVQYADLPAGFWRYETKYNLHLRNHIA